MLPTFRSTTHPGKLLKRLFLEADADMTATELADLTGLPLIWLKGLMTEKRDITDESAKMLASALGTSPEFWLNAQTAHDLTKGRLR